MPKHVCPVPSCKVRPYQNKRELELHMEKCHQVAPEFSNDAEGLRHYSFVPITPVDVFRIRAYRDQCNKARKRCRLSKTIGTYLDHENQTMETTKRPRMIVEVDYPVIEKTHLVDPDFTLPIAVRDIPLPQDAQILAPHHRAIPRLDLDTIHDLFIGPVFPMTPPDRQEEVLWNGGFVSSPEWPLDESLENINPKADLPLLTVQPNDFFGEDAERLLAAFERDIPELRLQPIGSEACRFSPKPKNDVTAPVPPLQTMPTLPTFEEILASAVTVSAGPPRPSSPPKDPRKLRQIPSFPAPPITFDASLTTPYNSASRSMTCGDIRAFVERMANSHPSWDEARTLPDLRRDFPLWQDTELAERAEIVVQAWRHVSGMNARFGIEDGIRRVDTSTAPRLSHFFLARLTSWVSWYKQYQRHQ